MDFKQIQELIKTVNRSNIGELSIEEKDFKITIKQKEDLPPVYTQAAPTQQYFQQPMQQAAPQLQQVAPALTVASGEPSGSKVPDNVVTIKSPMIGTFYRSSGPDRGPFVSVGDEIAPGKAVCIIEAMKLFNEIESEIKGIIVKVLVDDASPVEYDQPLFLVEQA